MDAGIQDLIEMYPVFIWRGGVADALLAGSALSLSGHSGLFNQKNGFVDAADDVVREYRGQDRWV